MATSDLGNLFQEAAEIASSLPETLQPIAFGKALEVILSRHGVGPSLRRVGSQRPRASAEREASAPPRASTRTPGRVGPKSALSQLLEQGYFAIRHEIADIQSHLKDSHGHDYSSKELAVSLLRLVREGQLKRGKSSEGQYEYWTEQKLLR
jgi:hypothetical protein